MASVGNRAKCTLPTIGARALPVQAAPPAVVTLAVDMALINTVAALMLARRTIEASGAGTHRGSRRRHRLLALSTVLTSTTSATAARVAHGLALVTEKTRWTHASLRRSIACASVFTHAVLRAVTV